MSKDTGGPAFPGFETTLVKGNGLVGDYIKQVPHAGMALRDYFAVEALNGVIACFRDHNKCESVETRVKKAYEYADAMLTERSKP